MRLATRKVNNVNLRLPLLLAWLEATKPHRVIVTSIYAPDGNPWPESKPRDIHASSSCHDNALAATSRA